jgi:uncharacterized protein YggE
MRRFIFALVCILYLLGASAMADAPVVSVQGNSIVSVTPDTATIELGVREVAEDVSKAQARVNEKLTAVIEKLEQMGVGRESIHTSSINIYQDYNYSDSMSTEPVIRYVAENSISVQFNDIDHAGDYIDAVFEAGANTFTGISFDASNTENEKKRALELAVENARQKADVLAAAAGMKITGIKAIREEAYGGYVNYKASNSYDFRMEEAASAGYATPVLTDKIQISASVSIDYKMEPLE